MCFIRSYIWTAERCFFHHNNHVVLVSASSVANQPNVDTLISILIIQERVQMQCWTRATFAFLQMGCFYGLTSSNMRALLSWSLACIAEVTRPDLSDFISVLSLWGVTRHFISLNPDDSCSKWFSLQIPKVISADVIRPFSSSSVPDVFVSLVKTWRYWSEVCYERRFMLILMHRHGRLFTCGVRGLECRRVSHHHCTLQG